MNDNSSNKKSIFLMSYSFKDDIEKVFDIFFNQSLLDKAGHLIKVTPKEKIINNNKTR